MQFFILCLQTKFFINLLGLTSIKVDLWCFNKCVKINATIQLKKFMNFLVILQKLWFSKCWVEDTLLTTVCTSCLFTCRFLNNQSCIKFNNGVIIVNPDAEEGDDEGVGGSNQHFDLVGFTSSQLLVLSVHFWVGLYLPCDSWRSSACSLHFWK